MRILLANVPDTHVGKTTDDWDLEASDIGIFPPLGLMYLAAVLRARTRHEVKIIDCMLGKMFVDDIVAEAKTFQPDLIGLTVYTPVLYDALQLSRKLKESCRGARLVWGGPHTLLFPEESMAHEVVDYLVVGEAEESFPSFCDAIEKNESLDHIKGIYYRNGASIVKTGEPGYSEDIDSIPFPAFDLLEYKRYFSAVGTGQAVGTICSSRGCPYQCTFCCKPYSTYRKRSVQNILSEMSLYYEKGIREFFFFDDLFNASIRRVNEISQAIIDKGWRIDWSFRGRVDAVDEEMLRLAKKSGCRQIFFGVEAATDEGLRAVKKRISIAQVQEAVRLSRRVGILSSTNWIIGFPHHKTREDVLRLIDTAVLIDSDFAQFNICIAYHGTEIFNEGVRKGLFQADLWRKYALHPEPDFVEPIWEEHLTRSELSKLLNLCYRRFYLRPKLILRRLFGIRRFRELRLFAKGALTILGMGGYRRKISASRK